MSKTLLSEQLKEHTKSQHQLLEKQIIPLIKAIRTTTDYSRLLMLFYTYFGAVELLVDNTLDVEYIPDYPQRRKTALLHTDLDVMNITIQPFATGAYLPAIENHLQAIGAMYVMEGSTLGGLHISKMISLQLQQQNTNAFSFFNGYKDETQQMWHLFKTAIDNMLLKPGEEATVINASNNTFERFANWISLH